MTLMTGMIKLTTMKYKVTIEVSNSKERKTYECYNIRPTKLNKDYLIINIGFNDNKAVHINRIISLETIKQPSLKQKKHEKIIN